MKRRTLLQGSSTHPITPDFLYDLYITKKKSVAEISKIYCCSQSKINYWLEKCEIPKRTISDAIYQLKNPDGDPFVFREPTTLKEGVLFGTGLALFWGEGTKRGNGGVRLSNNDPKLIRKFIQFLETFFSINKSKLRFSIQIFGDVNPEKALTYWVKELALKRSQFYKPLVIKVRGEGTYTYKSKHGTTILYFNNTKLKKILCEMIENIQ